MFQDGGPLIILIWLSLVQFIKASTNVILDERLCHKTFKMSGIDHYTVTYSGKDKLPKICSVAFTTNDFNKDICVSFDVLSDFDNCDFSANSKLPDKEYDCNTSKEELSTPLCSSYLNGITLYFNQIYRRRISRTILFVYLAPKGTGRPEYGNHPTLIDDDSEIVYKSPSMHDITYVTIGSVVGVIAIISICIIICCYCCCKQCCCRTSASHGTVVSRRQPQEVTLTSAPQPVPNQIQMGPAPNYPPGYQYPYPPQSPGYQGYAPVSQHDNRPVPSAPPPPMDSAPPPYPGY